jgi:hypothetical protein
MEKYEILTKYIFANLSAGRCWEYIEYVEPEIFGKYS